MKSTLALVGILAIFGAAYGQQCDADEVKTFKFGIFKNSKFEFT